MCVFVYILSGCMWQRWKGKCGVGSGCNEVKGLTRTDVGNTGILYCAADLYHRNVMFDYCPDFRLS
jgi:hypothetical protein